MSQTFTLPYPPSTNRLWRVFKGHMVLSDEARAYKEAAYYELRTKGARAVTGKVVVHMRVYRPRKAGDLDNRLKIVLDSLKGIAYVDDSQVIAIHMYRYEDKKNPRVLVTVEETL